MDTKGNVNCQWSSSTNNSGSFFCSYDEDENTLWILVSFIEALSLQALFYSFAILFLLQFFCSRKSMIYKKLFDFFARHTPMVWNYFSMSNFLLFTCIFTRYIVFLKFIHQSLNASQTPKRKILKSKKCSFRYDFNPIVVQLPLKCDAMVESLLFLLPTFRQISVSTCQSSVIILQ